MIKLEDTFTVDGFYLTQSYGNNPAYYSQFGLLFHEGVDFGHQNKTVEVRACHAGECLTAYSASTYGRYVIILDYAQGCATYYCHLSSASVVSGQQVQVGEVIGKMGETGNTSGPHVHFNFVLIDKDGVRKYKTKEQNQGYLDPQHPLDTTPPKTLPGVEAYKIEWGEGGAMADTIPVPKSDFENLVAKSSRYDEFVREGFESVAEVKQLLSDLRLSLDNAKRDIETEKNRAEVARTAFNDLVALCAVTLNTQQEPNQIKVALEAIKDELDRLDTLEKNYAALQVSSGKTEEELRAEIAKLKALLVQKDVLANVELADLIRELVRRLTHVLSKK